MVTGGREVAQQDAILPVPAEGQALRAERKGRAPEGAGKGDESQEHRVVLYPDG